MSFATLVATLLANLPELLRLVRLVVQNIEEAQRDRTFKEDLRAINAAFEARDPDALLRLFAAPHSTDSGVPRWVRLPPKSGSDV